MAVNLTSLVMQFLAPEVITQIASFLGVDRAAAQKGTTAAVPSLLAGLSDLVSKPAGASQFSKLLSSQQAGSLTDLLRKSDPEGLAQAGSGMLSSLFGGKTTDALAQAIGKFAGIGEGGVIQDLSAVDAIILIGAVSFLPAVVSGRSSAQAQNFFGQFGGFGYRPQQPMTPFGYQPQQPMTPFGYRPQSSTMPPPYSCSSRPALSEATGTQSGVAALMSARRDVLARDIFSGSKQIE